jgi:transcription-repair coupling factor (superfamily II helicase)
VLARAAHINKIDSGPSAIAFTPHAGFAPGSEPDSIELHNGRLLLREKIDDPLERLSKAENVLAEIAT